MRADRGSRAPAQARDEPDRLERDLGRHLAAPGGPVLEHDRDLPDAEAGEQGAVGQLDLEHIPFGADAL